MGNCCGILSGAHDPNDHNPPARPARSNFSGPGRTLASSKPRPGPGAPLPDAGAADQPPPRALSPSSPSPSKPPTAAVVVDDDDEAVQRREMVRLAAESRGAKGGGKLAQDLARQRAQGMDGARKQAAAEALRHREVDQQEEARRGD